MNSQETTMDNCELRKLFEIKQNQKIKIMKNILFLFFIQLAAVSLIAQPTVEWSQIYGGINTERINDIEQTTDGGFVMAGYSGFTNDVNNYWIVKLDETGNVEWQRNYGGSNTDIAHSIEQTTDGGYIVAGQAGSDDLFVGTNNGGDDVWILKLDEQGDIEWKKVYGGSGFDRAKVVVQTSDGGYMVASRISSDDGDIGGSNPLGDIWLVKLDQDGNLEWEQSYGSIGSEFLEDMQATADGGFIITGGSLLNDNFDYLVMKIDATGNLEWENTYGGLGAEISYTVQQTANGGYIVGGRSDFAPGNNGSNDVWIIKLNASGGLEWTKNYGGSEGESASAIRQTSDGGFLVAGGSSSNDGDVNGNNGENDLWLLKLTASGNFEWSETYGGSFTDGIPRIELTMDGGAIITVWTESSDGDVPGNNGGFDAWVIKFGPDIVGIPQIATDAEIIISPNPSIGTFTIQTEKLMQPFDLQIFDLLGRTIFTKKAVYENIEITEIPKGEYFIQITTNNDAHIEKVIIH